MEIYLTKDYHEDYGNVLFFHFENFSEPPDICCASPLDCGFDETYWTHFIPDFNFNSVMEQAEKLAQQANSSNCEQGSDEWDFSHAETCTCFVCRKRHNIWMIKTT